MPKFDHRFDNQIQRKDDLRFTSSDDAIEYADAQCRMYGQAQNVVPAEGDLFRIIEHPTKLDQAVHFVDEVL